MSAFPGFPTVNPSPWQSKALPVPSVFIADAAGILQFSFVHPDYKVRVPGAVILAAAKAIAAQKHEVSQSRRGVPDVHVGAR